MCTVMARFTVISVIDGNIIETAEVPELRDFR